MASYIDFLMYKRSLKWYKRLFWPLFLNDEEMDYFLERFSERSSLDDMRDWAYLDYMDYCKNPTQENKRRLDEDRWNIEWMRKKMWEDEMLENMSDEEKKEYMKRKYECYDKDGYKDRRQYGIWMG